jgi:type IV secretion system protein TrbL
MAVPTVDPGILDAVRNAISSVVTLGFLNLAPGAMRLLRQMAVCEVVICAGVMLTARGEIFQEILLKSVKLGFFVVLLTNLQLFSNAFMTTMVRGGLLVGGSHISVSEFLSPGYIFLLGIKTTQPLITYVENIKGTWSSITHLPVIIAYVFMTLIAWICFLLIACHVLIAQVEFQLITVMAMLLLPWGIFSHTAFLAEGVIGGIVGGAVRLGVLAAVTSIIVPILRSPLLNVTTPSGDVTYQSGLSLMAAAVVMLLASWTAPNYAAALLGTGPALTGQSLVRAAAVTVVAVGAGIRHMAASGGRRAARAGAT